MAGPPRSAAVQIVRPPAAAPVAASASPARPPAGARDSPVGDRRKDTTQRLCRNVLIYGLCRFQDSGCQYYHPPPGVDPATLDLQSSSPATTAPTLAASTSKDPKSLGAAHLSAPIFVPKTPLAAEASPTRTPAPSLPAVQQWPGLGDMGGLIGSLAGDGGGSGGMQPSMGYEETMMGVPGQGMEGGMFMPQNVRQTLDYHLYTTPHPPPSTHPSAHNPMLHSFFIPDDLRRSLQARHDAVYAPSAGGSAPGLPQELGVYHSLMPLGKVTAEGSRVYGHPAPVYRAVSAVDGNAYILRRIEGFKLVNEAAFGAIDTWRRMRHPNIVCLKEAFTTKAFNDNSLILVYDFHPDSSTVLDEHLNPEAPPLSMGRRRQGMPIPERVLWSYITQIANALKAIHSSGLAARNLDPSKVLITGKNRVRLNGCGILDVLAYDPQTPVAVFQQEDLVSFGKLVISLACEFFTPGQHPAAPLDHIARNYSPDIKNLVLFLISKPQPIKSIDDAIRMMGPRVLNEFDAMQNYVDTLEAELGGELENARLVRLLTKLGFINERAEFELDPRWSDTGDRYILKLFRDFVFHSIGVDGNPVLDLSHVLTCLNKLDAGLDERIMLVSRDDQSCLVVSYREIKSCIEAAFTELRNAGNPMRGIHR